MESKIRDRDIQYIIGNLLRYGVWIALSVAVLGGIIYLFNHEQETVHYGTFIEQNKTIFALISETISGTFSGSGDAIILLGIILLFLTPILRVFFSLIAFFIEKDYLYVCITLIVIGIICFSIFYGFAH
ncbi:DUF1634 domain-containing protein [Olivibacter sp. SDN3]|uniref:DUF1634 domain-containing protein n=1 Tax=Olivibacter sp. SDN3 TaxID=2764720 RepID=UPI0016516C7E|nr:DUF1634 domain-containing protein [Olivibacter sp. SDN3]QNL48349.1 DUF1634 domain-containing protein [Olivibacter sp. SDN3]